MKIAQFSSAASLASEIALLSDYLLTSWLVHMDC
jgi:hypothetical protein